MDRGGRCRVYVIHLGVRFGLWGFCAIVRVGCGVVWNLLCSFPCFSLSCLLAFPSSAVSFFSFPSVSSCCLSLSLEVSHYTRQVQYGTARLPIQSNEQRDRCVRGWP